MKKLFLILICLFLFNSIAFCQQSRLAVYVVGNEYFWEDGTQYLAVTGNNKSLIESAVISTLMKSGDFKIADRSETIQSIITNEFSTQSSGSVKVEQIVKLGNQIGADYLCVVEVERLSTNMKVVGKLINMEESSVIAATTFTDKTYNFSKDCPKLGERVAKALMRQFARKKNPAASYRIVGPLSFQEVFDFRIPSGYITLDEAGVSAQDALEEIYEIGLLPKTSFRLVLYSTKKVSTDYITENLMCQYVYFSSIKERDEYPFELWSRDNIKYKLEGSGKKLRYIPIGKGFKLKKGEEPPYNDFYIILIPKK